MFDAQKIKNDFPILSEKNGKRLVFLDSGATSQKPEVVIESMNRFYRESNANIHRGVYDLSVESTRLVDEAREKVAKFIGADVQEVIFTRNASESINLVAYSWGESLMSGDVVVTTKMEHHSNLIPWQELCRRKGLELRIVDVDKEGMLVMNRGKVEKFEENGLRVTVGGFDDLLDSSVKMVAVTGVSNALGSVVDLKEVVRKVKDKSEKSLILVDGSQMVPHMKVEVKKLGVDFLAFSGHKMLGPTGVGVLWGKKEILRTMKPFLYGGDMIGEVKITGATWADLPNKFEAGTPDIAGIIGLGVACDYLTAIGMDEVRNHEKELVEYGIKKLEALERDGLIKFFGPREAMVRGGALTFNVVGIHAHDAAQVLNNFGIAVRSGQHCAAPLVTSFGEVAMVRATMYIYNDKNDIDYLVEKISEVPKVFL